MCSLCRPLHSAYGDMRVKLSERRGSDREREAADRQRSRCQCQGQVISPFLWCQSSRWYCLYQFSKMRSWWVFLFLLFLFFCILISDSSQMLGLSWSIKTCVFYSLLFIVAQFMEMGSDLDISAVRFVVSQINRRLVPWRHINYT